jgi:hypothetical protein
MKRTYQQDDSYENVKRMRIEEQKCFPVDCLLPIFEYCDAQGVAYSLRGVCTTWKDIVSQNEQQLWKAQCMSEFPMLKEVMTLTDTMNWKQFYSKKAVCIPPNCDNEDDVQDYENYQKTQLKCNNRYYDLNARYSKALIDNCDTQSIEEEQMQLLIQWVSWLLYLYHLF